ncbi:hypothetical protein Tco_1484264 [Tanacetum coccineum]
MPTLVVIRRKMRSLPKRTSNLASKEANYGGSSFFNVRSNSTSTTPIVEKIDKLKRLIIDGKLTLVDDEGKPLEKVDYSGDHDGEDKVEPVDCHTPKRALDGIRVRRRDAPGYLKYKAYYESTFKFSLTCGSAIVSWMWKSSEGVGEVGVDRVKEWAVCGVVGWWFCAVVRYRVAAGGRVLVVVLWDMLAFFTPLVEAKEKFLLSTRVSDTDVEEENSKSKDVMKDNKEAEATKRVWPYPPGFTPRENDVENVEMNNQKDNCDGEFGNVNKIFDEVNFSSGFNTYKKAGGESIVSNHCRESEGSRKECQKKRVYGIIYVMSFDNGMVQYLSGSASKMSKLDRFLMSESLLSECPNLSAITLDRFLSDHRPILLRESTHDYGPIPFWFFHYWLEMEGFENFVNEELVDLEMIIDKGDASSDTLHKRAEVVKSIQEVDKLCAMEASQKAKSKWAIEGAQLKILPCQRYS